MYWIHNMKTPHGLYQRPKHHHTHARFVQPDQVTRDRKGMRTAQHSTAQCSLYLCHYILFLISVTISHRTKKPYQLTIMENMHFHLAKNLHKKSIPKIFRHVQHQWHTDIFGNCLKILLFHHFEFSTVSTNSTTWTFSVFYHCSNLYILYGCMKFMIVWQTCF